MHAQRSLPAEAGSARAARRFVADTLADWGISAVEDSVVLLVSELVTNAVLHARSALILALDRSDTLLRVSVRDNSPVLPQQRRYSIDAATGRGLGLVDLMSTDWGVTAEGAGKEIWFTIALTGEPPPEPEWTEFDIDAVDAL